MVDITCYLPDELGAKAKEADLPFSRMLRAAVEAELEKREYGDRRARLIAWLSKHEDLWRDLHSTEEKERWAGAGWGFERVGDVLEGGSVRLTCHRCETSWTAVSNDDGHPVRESDWWVCPRGCNAKVVEEHVDENTLEEIERWMFDAQG